MNYSSEDAMFGNSLSLFRVGGTLISVPVLSIKESEEWLGKWVPLALEKEQEAGKRTTDMPERMKRRKALLSIMFEAVCAYSPEQLKQEDLKKQGITIPQIIEGYQTLVGVSDPFECLQVSALENAKSLFAGVPQLQTMTEKASDGGK